MPFTDAASSHPFRPLATGGLVWFALAVAFGATGRLASLAPPAPQLIIVTLAVAAVVVGTAVPTVRARLKSVPLRAWVGLHAIRFIGIWFVVLGARGVLSPLFAERAGWGDIAAALLAVLLVATGEPRTRLHRALYLAWNLFALADLAVAVGTASWVALHGLEPGMGPLLRLPLSLVPTFLVPILIASHVLLFLRLSRAAATERALTPHQGLPRTQ